MSKPPIFALRELPILGATQTTQSILLACSLSKALRLVSIPPFSFFPLSVCSCLCLSLVVSTFVRFSVLPCLGLSLSFPDLHNSSVQTFCFQPLPAAARSWTLGLKSLLSRSASLPPQSILSLPCLLGVNFTRALLCILHNNLLRSRLLGSTVTDHSRSTPTSTNARCPAFRLFSCSF